MSWITFDRYYVLRNGWRVLVTGPLTVRFGPGKRFSWTGIEGVGPRGRKMSWQANGAYQSDGAHKLDIIMVAEKKKRKH